MTENYNYSSSFIILFFSHLYQFALIKTVIILFHFPGFENSVREIGLNLNGAEMILKDLAIFHGTAIALKLKKPDVFKEKIRPQCTAFDFPKEPVIPIFNILRKLIQTFPEYAHLAEKATNFVDKETPRTFREPFATLIHFDLWVNNILNKFENDEIARNVFVDFQVYDYRSPASDVFFFMWSSVQKEVLEQHIDHLISHYHKKLLNTLKCFEIDTAMFELENFEKELQTEASFEFGHALMFTFLLKFVKNLDNHNMHKFDLELSDINQKLKDMIYFMVKECSKRGWLY